MWVCAVCCGGARNEERKGNSMQHSHPRGDESDVEQLLQDEGSANVVLLLEHFPHSPLSSFVLCTPALESSIHSSPSLPFTSSLLSILLRLLAGTLSHHHHHDSPRLPQPHHPGHAQDALQPVRNTIAAPKRHHTHARERPFPLAQTALIKS